MGTLWRSNLARYSVNRCVPDNDCRLREKIEHFLRIDTVEDMVYWIGFRLFYPFFTLGVRVSADFGTPRRRGRPPSKRGGAFMLTSTVPSLLNSSHSTVVVEDDSIDDEADQAPEVNDEHDVEMKTRPPEISQNPIHTQADAERLLADISALSAARPLLRCALSKTVQSEMSQTAEGSPPSRRSATRQRRPTIHADGTPSPIKSLSSAGDSELLAYDIESLRELLTQDGLPGGPSQIVSQLR